MDGQLKVYFCEKSDLDHNALIFKKSQKVCEHIIFL